VKKYNVGIVGYGWVATAHIDAINATSLGQVTAVYSSRPLISKELSARHGSAIKAHQTLELLLGDPDVDVVSICSYPDRHMQEAVAAARAGKHLIIEKPIALKLEDCRAMFEAAA
jgi:predicted dehydrogenase